MRSDRIYMEDAIEDSCLAFEWEGGDAAEGESDDEEDEPEADLAEAMGGGGHSSV